MGTDAARIVRDERVAQRTTTINGHTYRMPATNTLLHIQLRLNLEYLIGLPHEHAKPTIVLVLLFHSLS